MLEKSGLRRRQQYWALLISVLGIALRTPRLRSSFVCLLGMTCARRSHWRRPQPRFAFGKALEESGGAHAPAAMTDPSASEFEFPPFHRLPPFFTLQPHEGVRAKQLAMWRQLILDFCSSTRTFVIDISEGGAATGVAGKLFRNTDIQRQLTAEGRRAIAEHLVKEGAAAWGDAAGDGKNDADRHRLLVFWRSPREWADIVLRWVEETGRLGSVETVLSLVDGDISEGEAFHGVPRELMLHALQELERRGRAKIFRGSGTHAEGVKFLQA